MPQTPYIEALQTVYIQTKDWEQKTISAQSGENFLANIMESLKVAGLDKKDLSGSRLSLSPFKPFMTPVPETQPLDNGFPVWKPASKKDVAPHRYPATDDILSSDDCAVYLAIDLFDTPLWVTPAMIYTEFELFPAFPSGTKLLYGRHWERIYSEVVKGPQKITREVARTNGASETDRLILSAELGIPAAGLSARLSASTTHSITINSQTQVTDSYDISANEGEVNFWILWQMVEVFTLTDPNGNPVTYEGCLISKNTGDPMDKFPVMFPQGILTNRKPEIYSAITTFKD